MSIESFQARRERAQKIIARLALTYPDAHTELNFTDPLQLLIATILSAQCTDKKVNAVTPLLFKEYLTATDYAMADAARLERQIHSLGFFRSKTKNIQGCCRELVQRHAGQVPKTMSELIQLPGVGRKTANVVLGNAFGIDEGIVVDTHVGRLSQRLGLSKHHDPAKIEQDLIKLVPKKNWTLLSHLLIWHGRRRCNARKPDCSNCEVSQDCPTGKKQLHKPEHFKENRSLKKTHNIA
jgi:endonuclease III